MLQPSTNLRPTVFTTESGAKYEVTRRDGAVFVTRTAEHAVEGSDWPSGTVKAFDTVNLIGSLNGMVLAFSGAKNGNITTTPRSGRSKQGSVSAGPSPADADPASRNARAPARSPLTQTHPQGHDDRLTQTQRDDRRCGSRSGRERSKAGRRARRANR